MIEIKVDRYLTEIRNLPLELVDRIKFDLKIELNQNSVKNILKYSSFPLSEINSEADIYSPSTYQKGTLTILTGYTIDLIKLLKSTKQSYNVTKVFKSSGVKPQYTPKLDTRDAQKEFVQLALKWKRLLLEAPTAFGKTRAVAEYLWQFQDEQGAKLVLVPTIDLMYQTQKSLQEYLNEDVGIIGDGKFNPLNVTVASIDTLFSRIKKQDKTAIGYLENVKILIGDEVHEYANFSGATVVKALVNCRYMLGVSATLCIKNINLIVGLFGPIIKRYPIADAIANETILNPIIRFKEIPPIQIPAAWETQEYSNYLYNKSYNLCIVNNQPRNEIIAKCIAELLEDSYYPVLTLVKKVGTSGGKVSHAKNIQDELAKLNIHIPIVHGKSKDRQEIVQQLKDKTLLGCIATDKIMGTGVDIKSLNGIVLAGAGSSNKELIQNIGRGVRKEEESKRPRIYDFYDNTHFFKNQSEKRLILAKELYPDVERAA